MPHGATAGLVDGKGFSSSSAHLCIGDGNGREVEAVNLSGVCGQGQTEEAGAAEQVQHHITPPALQPCGGAHWTSPEDAGNETPLLIDEAMSFVAR